jgi:hypothetical protein
MARNKVQFQKGLNEGQFAVLYGTEDQCREAVMRWRTGGMGRPAGQSALNQVYPETGGSPNVATTAFRQTLASQFGGKE